MFKFLFFEFFVNLFLSKAYYLKLPTNNISHFIAYNVKESIKYHLVQSLSIVHDDDVLVLHIKGLFNSQKELEFVKYVMMKKFLWSRIVFWLWYYSLKLFLKQSNILTTIIYVRDVEKTELVSIFIEYTTSKVHYLVAAVVTDEIQIKQLKCFKYVDVIINCLEKNIKTLCLGCKPDIIKIGLGAEVDNSFDSISDIIVRLLSTT